VGFRWSPALNVAATAIVIGGGTPNWRMDNFYDFVR
jgi:hypothetical protein